MPVIRPYLPPLRLQQAINASDLAQQWATKTDAEVETGQGYGAQKYANDAKASEANTAAARDQSLQARDQAQGYATQAAAKGGFYQTRDLLTAITPKPAVITGFEVYGDPDTTKRGQYFYDPAFPTQGINGFLKTSSLTLSDQDAHTPNSYDAWSEQGRDGQSTDFDSTGRDLSGVPAAVGGLAAAASIRDATSGISIPRILGKALAPVIGLGIMGQSLAISGGTYTPIIYTPVAPSQYVFMPSPGVFPAGRSFSTCVPAYEALNNETFSTIGESGQVLMAKGIHDRVFAATGQRITLSIFVAGAGGTSIDNLARGTFTFEEALRIVALKAQYWASQGRRFVMRAVRWIHGNEDVLTLSKAGYIRRLAQYVERFNRAVKEITGQTEDCIFYCTQVDSAATGYMNEYGVPQATLDACRQHPLIRWIGGGYAIDHPDGTHSDSPGYVRYGEHAIDPIADDLMGRGLAPFATTGARLIGPRTIRLDYFNPYPPFVFDFSDKIVRTANVAGYYGIKVDIGEDEAATPKVTGISLVGGTPILDGSSNVIGYQSNDTAYHSAQVDLTLEWEPPTHKPIRVGLGIQSQPAPAGAGRTTGARLFFRGSTNRRSAIDLDGNVDTGTSTNPWMINPWAARETVLVSH